MSNLERLAAAIASDPGALRAMEDSDPACEACNGTGRREGYAPCPRSGAPGSHARCCGDDGVVYSERDCEDCGGQGWVVVCGRCGVVRPPVMKRIDKTKPHLGSRLMTCREWAGCEED